VLDSKSEQRVDDLLKEIKLSSEVVQELLRMEGALRAFAESIGNFQDETHRITRGINADEDDLADIERRITAVDKEMGGYDAEKIKAWHEERRRFEQTHDENLVRLGGLEAQKKKLTGDTNTLKERLDEELKKEAKAKKLKVQMDFCAKGLDVVRKTKETIMRETRERIQSETKTLFLELALRKGTFADVRISEGYNISVIHSMGYECLGSMSAAERELLALSFTLALHRISGFDSPILIDTPVARVADEHRVNFGRTLLDVSTGKQIILLFTSAEYSEDLSRLLDAKSSNRFSLRLSADEKETKLEVI
jgi:DNA sulfur modification protein DndD